MSRELHLAHGEASVIVRRDAEGGVVVLGKDGDSHTFTVTPAGDAILVQGEHGTSLARAVRDGQTIWVSQGGRTWRLDVESGARRRRSAPGLGGLGAPMPGQVLQHLVEPGSHVEPGTPLLVLEAMKMQLEIKAPAPGRVVRFLAQVGEQVPSGTALVELDTE